MLKNLLIKTCGLLLLCSFFSGKIFSQTSYPFDTIMNRIYADIKWKSAWQQKDSTVDVYQSGLQSNGSWSDIVYTSPDGTHLNRVLSLAQAFTSDSTTHQNNTTTYTNVLKALRFWCSATRTNPNWYVNVISFPQQLGQIMIVMRYAGTDIPSTLKDTLIARMNFGAANDVHTQVGSNESDVAVHYIYRACFTNSTSIMDTAFTRGYEPVTYTTGGDGVTYDNCYLAHGGQLGINSYGSVFLTDEFQIAGYLAGTSYALPAVKLPVLMNFYKNGYLKAGRNGYVDFNTVGRGISRGAGINHDKTFGLSIAGYLPKARATDPSQNASWDSVANGSFQSVPLHTHFWRSDYDLHLRPGYTFNIHTVSTRTYRTERGNGENLLGKFLPDGATDIQRWGGEYYNIYPVWEWDKIPGVTSRDFSTDAGSAISSDWGTPGTTTFVGGVTDSLYGATVYDMNYNSVTAKKSWFQFDNEVVCLGAGITSTQAESIVTSVNQCWLFGQINVKNGGTVSTIDSAANTATTYTSPQWVLHDSIGYFFPAGGNVTVSNKVQTGSWYRINTGYSSASVSGTVFNMWLNHGASPNKATYAYTVVPGLGSTTDMQNYNASNIRIVKNTDSVQAVRHLGLDILQVVFYKAGTLTDSSISVTVNKPCVVMLKNLHSKRVSFYIADPAQQISNIIVSVELPGISGAKQLQASLPQAPYGGLTAFYIVDSATHYNPPANPDSVLAMADAYVRDGTYASTNYGTATGLVVKNDATSYARQTYLKFNLSAVKRPVTKATLRLYSSGGNTSANTTQLQLYKSKNTGWTENGITWNNKPTGDSLLNTTQAQVAAGYITWDITNQVNSLPKDSLLTLQVVSTVAGGNTDMSFYSKEGGNNGSQKPYVVLDNSIPVTDSLVSTADAYVRNGTYASINYGTATGLVVKNDATSYARQTYLKFDASSINKPVIKATLRLYSSGGNASANTTQWQLYKSNNTSWTETGITWNNKPSADTLLATTQGQVAAGYINWDITNEVNSLPAGSQLTLQVVSTVSGGNTDVTFYSKETNNASFKPYIIYSFDSSINSESLNMSMQKPLMLSKSYSSANNITGIKLFPNPAISFIIVQSKEMIKSITMFSTNGNTIKSINNVNNNMYKINISNLAKGNYLLNIQGQNTKATKKVLKLD